jgi:Transglycosylase SLT domain
MSDPTAPKLSAGGGRRRIRAPLALCVFAAAGVSGTASAPAPRDPPHPTPSTQVSIAAADAPSIADLLIVDRGGFSPIGSASLLFPQADGSVRSLITSSAVANHLPPDFLLRLLRQESGLNPNAVSPVGAQGIAQFMPGTAAERGLRNPFDPVEAIPKSAELLREHQARFGNLGLAAAAYNAGPQRVREWLGGRAGMPAETRDYVVRITGRTVEDWATGNSLALPGAMPSSMTLSSFGSASFSRAGPTVSRANLFETALAPRGAPKPIARSAKRAPQRLSPRIQQPRSEQALCALLNGEGRTCLVQAVY